MTDKGALIVEDQGNEHEALAALLRKCLWMQADGNGAQCIGCERLLADTTAGSRVGLSVKCLRYAEKNCEDSCGESHRGLISGRVRRVGDRRHEIAVHKTYHPRRVTDRQSLSRLPLS